MQGGHVENAPTVAFASDCFENISHTVILIRSAIYSLEVDFIACFTTLKKRSFAYSFEDIFHKNEKA